MAQLHRYVKLNDRQDTQVFTFIVSSSLGKEKQAEITSKEFTYGFQKWTMTLARLDKHISAMLSIKNISEGTLISLDFCFTMINRDHFTKNEMFMEKAVEYTFEKTSHGRKTFVSILDLTTRGFQHDHGQFIVEVELRGLRTSFEQVLQIPKEHKDLATGPYKNPKYETNYFSFGSYDWNISVLPYGDEKNDGRPMVFLTRQTCLGHLCKVKYQVTLGQGDRILQSDVLEQVLDTSGNPGIYDVRYNIYNVTTAKSRLKLRIELLSVVAISEIQIDPFMRGKNRGTFYDRDKQAWVFEVDTSQEYLHLYMFYQDIFHVPRKYMRCMTFGVRLQPIGPMAKKTTKPAKTINSPYHVYFSQQEQDEGMDLGTEVRVDELKGANSVFLHLDTRKITIYVEWIDSLLLYHYKYHRLDDVAARHRQQMRREILALQQENYALEKQLYSYQQSIAKTHSRGKNPDGESLDGRDRKELRRDSQETSRDPVIGRENIPNSRGMDGREYVGVRDGPAVEERGRRVIGSRDSSRDRNGRDSSLNRESYRNGRENMVGVGRHSRESSLSRDMNFDGRDMRLDSRGEYRDSRDVIREGRERERERIDRLAMGFERSEMKSDRGSVSSRVVTPTSSRGGTPPPGTETRTPPSSTWRKDRRDKYYNAHYPPNDRHHDRHSDKHVDRYTDRHGGATDIDYNTERYSNASTDRYAASDRYNQNAVDKYTDNYRQSHY